MARRGSAGRSLLEADQLVRLWIPAQAPQTLDGGHERIGAGNAAEVLRDQLRPFPIESAGKQRSRVADEGREGVLRINSMAAATSSLLNCVGMYIESIQNR